VRSVSFASLWWLLRREAVFQILAGDITGLQARRLRAVIARQEWLKLRVSAARALQRTGRSLDLAPVAPRPRAAAPPPGASRRRGPIEPKPVVEAGG
jgi:hypothetical protein